jgi:hypothetical protein
VEQGGKCETSKECRQGLLCDGGVCETAPSCESNDDCSTGKCTDGKCDIGSDGDVAPYKKNWFGLHLAQDIAIIGGPDVCGSESDYECYDSGSSSSFYGGPPYPGTGIAKGTALATQRLLLSYDRAFTPNLTGGVRVGYAFSGGPPAVSVDQNGAQKDKIKFLPFHLEGRITYWIRPLSKLGFRPYVFGGGGMAQVDAKVKVTIFDCSVPQLNGMDPPEDCAVGGDGTNKMDLTRRQVDAWKKLGQGFITVGGGVVYAIKPQLGIQANFNFLYMLGSSGPVLQPSVGVVYGL